MKMSFDVTAKKLFGVKYERLIRTLFLELVAFWGLHISGLQVEIAPSILYLMAGAFSGGVMWQALSSDDNRANLENLFMLPFEGRTLVLSYAAALGAYTLLTKTAGLLAVVWAVGHWSWAEILGSILCALAAIVIVSCLYPLRLGRTDVCQAGRDRHRKGHPGEPSGRHLPAFLPGGGGSRPAGSRYRAVSGPGDRHPTERLYQGDLGARPGVYLFRVPALAINCSQKIHIQSSNSDISETFGL